MATPFEPLPGDSGRYKSRDTNGTDLTPNYKARFASGAMRSGLSRRFDTD